MLLYGTPVCPFTRRPRILAAELGAEVALVDVRTPEGEAALAQLHPQGRYPVADFDGTVVFGDRAIQTELMLREGRPRAKPGLGRLRKVDRDFWQDANLIDVVDASATAALDRYALIRHGLNRKAKPLVELEERVRLGLEWLAEQLDGPYFRIAPEPGFGLAEIALVSTLDAIRYRDLHPIPEDGPLAHFLEHHRERRSVARTAP